MSADCFSTGLSWRWLHRSSSVGMEQDEESVWKAFPAPLQDFTGLPRDDWIMLHKPQVPKDYLSSGVLQNQEMEGLHGQLTNA